MNRQTIIEQLKKDESFRSKAYWDVNGWRYGYGCTAPNSNATITESEASELLGRRVDQAIQEYHSIFADLPMCNARQGAFVNMIFNMGGSRFSKFTKMIHAVKENDWATAAIEAKDSLWYKQTGNRAKRIVEEISNG